MRVLTTLRHLFRRRFNLDCLPEGTVSIDVTLGSRPDSASVRLLTMCILRQALQDGAAAVQIFYDAEDEFFRLLYCVPDGQDPRWYEMVPGPNDIMQEVVTLVRRRAGLSPAQPEGRLEYVHQNSIRRAVVFSPDENEAVVYFGDARPRPLDKSAGDKPGQLARAE